MGDLILSIFPGIDLLGRAFELEWPDACIVRGPDLLWGGDIKQFYPPPGKFAGVIGGPPCQAFSTVSRLRNGPRENLIPEFERCIAEAQPDWFLMENVRGAPLPIIEGYQVKALLLNNRWLGEKQNRLRRFSFGTPEGLTLVIDAVSLFEHPEYEYCVTAHDHTGGNWENSRRGKGRSWRQMAELQGLPAEFNLPSFTVKGKGIAIGNGVPLPMGRAVAKAVRRALESRPSAIAQDYTAWRQAHAGELAASVAWAEQAA